MNLLAFYPAVEFQWLKSQHPQFGDEEDINTAIIKLVKEIEIKNRGTQKIDKFGDIVYFQYSCPDEDDMVQEDECSTMCLYR